MRDQVKTFMIEDAEIFWPNFSGKEGPYNRKGEKSFAVYLPEDMAEQMLHDGWNVKYPNNPNREYDEDEAVKPFIRVAVNYDNYPPRVVMITSKGRINLDNDTVEVLDWVEVSLVDLICRGNPWDINGKSGIKAYLKTMFITINEDALERKYDINDVEQ
jgi:hypothetical protein